MKISIIIVNWNTKELLIQCLNSILKEIELKDNEIIVVDNNSTDGSCEAIMEHYSNIILLRNKTNEGFSKANNIGIKKSSGQYICLVNSDIKLLPNCMNLLYNYMDQNPSVGIIAPKILNPDLTYQLTCRRFPTIKNNITEAFGLHGIFSKSTLFSGEHRNLDKQSLPCEVEILGGCFWFIRRESIEQVGLLDETFFFYGEDKDYCTRFYKAGWKLIYYPDARAIHYGGASSSKKPIEYYIQMQKAQLLFNKKYFSAKKYLIFLILKYIRTILRIFLYSILYIFISSNRKQTKIKINKFFSTFIWLVKFSRK